MDSLKVKNILESQYIESLKIESNYYNHPICIIQSIKSLIGIDINKPLKKLIDFSQDYIASHSKIKRTSKFKSKTLPQYISYKNLEEALINNNKNDANKYIYFLFTVSNGMQIIEFLLEYCLKYRLKAFVLIWSVYKMTLFLNNINIFRSLMICVDAIINNNIQYHQGQILNIDNCVRAHNICKEQFYHEFSLLYCINYESLVRKDKFQIYIQQLIYPMCDKNKKIKLFECDNEQLKLGRVWIYNYLNELDYSLLNVQLILKLDVARGMLKMSKEQNIEQKIIWGHINRMINFK